MTEAQAKRTPWRPPVGPLGALTARAYAAVDLLRPSAAALEAAAAAAPVPTGFADALRRPEVAVIAELKKQSPSKGAINADMDVTARALDYVHAGASALSVLTESTRFGGSLDDLHAVRQAMLRATRPIGGAPLLRKDFIIDPRQIREAVQWGADAILLIVAILDDRQLADLLRLATESGLTALVEVHNERELERALEAGAQLIGVNNRDLAIFRTDLGLSERLIPQFPKTVIAVSESGIATAADAARARACGAHAVLVGEALMRAPDTAALIAAFRAA